MHADVRGGSMLHSIGIRNFKSFASLERIQLAPFSVFLGPNAAGKSNFLEAIQVLSRLATERTLADALGGSMRGRALEAFKLPSGGLAALLETPKNTFAIHARFSTSEDSEMEYRVEVALRSDSGSLTLEDEFLAFLTRTGEIKGEPLISRSDQSLRIRRKGGGSRPREEKVGLGYTLLSDERISGRGYEGIEAARRELSSWRTYYLDPRVAMRSLQAPQEVDDIGPQGDLIAPFLYRLRAEHPRRFDAVRRVVRTLIPSIEDVRVDLDTRRGVLDIEVRQDGIDFSSRVVSEGTLRILALACIAANPWGGSLVAFEEPENGVHPMRIAAIAEMLLSLATRDPKPPQLIVTTHSTYFCDALYQLASARGAFADQVAMFQVSRRNHASRIAPFDPPGPLFARDEVGSALSDPLDDGPIGALARRGLLDE